MVVLVELLCCLQLCIIAVIVYFAQCYYNTSIISSIFYVTLVVRVQHIKHLRDERYKSFERVIPRLDLELVSNKGSRILAVENSLRVRHATW